MVEELADAIICGEIRNTCLSLNGIFHLVRTKGGQKVPKKVIAKRVLFSINQLLRDGTPTAQLTGMRQEGTVPERSQRAIDIMRSVLPEARKVSRVHLTVPASVSCPSLNCRDRLAILRDLSTTGAFFYAELDASEGSTLTLQFVLSAFGKDIRLVCEATVVRVDRFPRGAATGVAVEFTHCDMLPSQTC